MTDLQEKAFNLTHSYIDKAKDLYDMYIPYPSISFKLKGRVAGLAGNHLIKYNAILLEENKDTFLNRTVPHEVAHVVVRHLYPQGRMMHKGNNGRYSSSIKAHGKEWKRVMVDFDIKDISRCHSYDTTRSKQTRKNISKSFLYSCECSTFNLTIIRHRRAINGADYFCKRCKTSLMYNEMV